MSPKVKFLQKEDIQKNKEENSLISFEGENENEKNNTISDTKMDKSYIYSFHQRIPKDLYYHFLNFLTLYLLHLFFQITFHQ